MSQRFPPPSSDEADLITTQIDAAMEKALGTHDKSFNYKDANGAPTGPFAVLAYTPDLFPSYAVFATAIVSQNDFLPKERELAVLAVTAVHDVPYMRYAHTRMALGMGLTKEQVAMMVKGVQPKGLTEEENIIYATALELAETKTPVKEETWQRAEALLGKARCARLAQTVGLYLYTGSLLRLGAVSAPDN